MKKIISSFIISVYLICTFLTISIAAFSNGSAETEDELVIYVSPSGSDDGDGSLKHMLNTPDGALNYIRKSGVLKQKPVKVIFKNGDYYINKSVSIGKEDAGSEKYPVIWEAEEKGKVRFLGSTKLDNSLFEPVTDRKVLKKISADARNKIYQLDLTKNGIHIDEAQAHLWSNSTFTQPYTDLIRNGKQQMLSRWPNGQNHYVKWDKVLVGGKTGKSLRGVQYGAKILFNNPRILRWKDVKNAYIMGHISTTYSIDSLEIESVNTEKGTIQFMNAAQYTPQDTSPRELQIFNLLEELDIPSEWYIDAQTQILYYYPPEPIDDSTELELITLNEPMVTFENGANLFYTMKDITFSMCRKDLMLISGTNVTVDGCTFTYSKGKQAICAGDYNTEPNYRITGSVIAHCDGRAVTMYGNKGQTKANRIYSRFTNNYVYDIGQVSNSLGHAVVSEEGSCVEISHNTMHYLPQGVTFGGWTTCDWKIKNNEFYDFGMNLSDVGGFYIGYTGSAIGTEVAYNFFYDYEPVNNSIGRAVQGVYFDDGACYGYVHHNIFLNGAHGAVQIGGGKYNRAIGNIMINMGRNCLETDHRIETWSNGPSIAAQTHSQSAQMVGRVSRYKREFPWVNHLEESARQIPYGNTILNNISNTAIRIDDHMRQYGNISGNVQIDSLSHFVNPEKYDYRIKDTSLFAVKIPELTQSNFDLQDIGCAADVTDKIDKSFNLLAPIKDDDFDSTHKTLLWEKATTADRYNVVVAKDREFSDIVFTKEVPYNYCDVNGLEDGKQYWWYVEACNKSFKRGDKWKSKVASFNNKIANSSEVDDLLYYASTASYILKSEDLTQYDEKFVSSLSQACADTLAFHTKAKNRRDVTSEEIQAQENKLEAAKEAFYKSEKTKYTKLNQEYFTDKDYWYLNEHDAEVNGKEITFKETSGVKYSNVILKEQPEMNVVLAFRAKLDYLLPDVNRGWASFEVRRKATDNPAWNNGGVIVIIKRTQLELQTYPGGGLIKTLENKWIKDGEWHEYALGVINKPDYDRFVFVVDGEVVFNHNDYNKYIDFPGYFGSYISSVNLTLAPSEFEYDNVDTGAQNFFVSKNGWTETGNWSLSDIQSSIGGEVKKAHSRGSSIECKIGDLNGHKKVYFRKIASSDGDKQAKITISSNFERGREGDETTKEINLDLSSGNEDWVLIDEGLYKDGDVAVTLSGSDSGYIYANAIRIENVED